MPPGVVDDLRRRARHRWSKQLAARPGRARVDLEVGQQLGDEARFQEDVGVHR